MYSLLCGKLFIRSTDGNPQITYGLIFHAIGLRSSKLRNKLPQKEYYSSNKEANDALSYDIFGYSLHGASYLLVRSYYNSNIKEAMQQYNPRQTLTNSETRILKGVIELLASNGYAQTSIGELGLLLGVSKGLIHYHFPNKEVLFQETIAYIYAEARRYMERQVWNTDNPWVQIKTFISLSCQYYADHGQLIRALQEIRANFKPRQSASLAEVFSRDELRQIEKIITTGQTLGTFRAFDPAFGALTLRMSLNGAAQKILAAGHSKQHASLCATELTEMFCRAWAVGQ